MWWISLLSLIVSLIVLVLVALLYANTQNSGTGIFSKNIDTTITSSNTDKDIEGVPSYKEPTSTIKDSTKNYGYIYIQNTGNSTTAPVEVHAYDTNGNEITALGTVDYPDDHSYWKWSIDNAQFGYFTLNGDGYTTNTILTSEVNNNVHEFTVLPGLNDYTN